MLLRRAPPRRVGLSRNVRYDGNDHEDDDSQSDHRLVQHKGGTGKKCCEDEEERAGDRSTNEQ